MLQSAVSFEKLTVAQAIIFSAFYGTQRFIIMFTRVLHWILSAAASLFNVPLLVSHYEAILVLLYCICVLFLCYIHNGSRESGPFVAVGFGPVATVPSSPRRCSGHIGIPKLWSSNSHPPVCTLLLKRTKSQFIRWREEFSA